MTILQFCVCHCMPPFLQLSFTFCVAFFTIFASVHVLFVCAVSACLHGFSSSSPSHEQTTSHGQLPAGDLKIPHCLLLFTALPPLLSLSSLSLSFPLSPSHPPGLDSFSLLPPLTPLPLLYIYLYPPLLPLFVVGCFAFCLFDIKDRFMREADKDNFG